MTSIQEARDIVAEFEWPAGVTASVRDQVRTIHPDPDTGETFESYDASERVVTLEWADPDGHTVRGLSSIGDPEWDADVLRAICHSLAVTLTHDPGLAPSRG